MASLGAPGLYGKIPAHGDFVRLRAAEGAARPFVLWLEEASEAAKRAGAPCGPAPVRVLFQAPGAARALLGVLAGSEDRVGRRFPLAIFAQAEGPDLAAALPALAVAAEGFLREAAALAREAAGLPAAEVLARAERLALPGPAEIAARATAARARAAGTGARELMARLFGDPAAGQSAYALHCFRSACRPGPGRERAGATAVLECPVQVEGDPWLWLELARRGASTEARPSALWGEGEGARMLLSMGPMPPSVFGLLWRAGARDGRVWPLVTESEAAIAAARRALGAQLADGLERGGLSVEQLVALAMPSGGGARGAR